MFELDIEFIACAWIVWKVYRFEMVADGRGRALRRIWFGGRSRDTRGGTIPLPPFAATGRDGTFGCFVAGCTNVAFTFSFDGANDSGVSPRLKLLFELPDERLCGMEYLKMNYKQFLYLKIFKNKSFFFKRTKERLKY